MRTLALWFPFSFITVYQLLKHWVDGVLVNLCWYYPWKKVSIAAPDQKMFPPGHLEGTLQNLKPSSAPRPFPPDKGRRLYGQFLLVWPSFILDHITILNFCNPLQNNEHSITMNAWYDTGPVNLSHSLLLQASKRHQVREKTVVHLWSSNTALLRSRT